MERDGSHLCGGGLGVVAPETRQPGRRSSPRQSGRPPARSLGPHASGRTARRRAIPRRRRPRPAAPRTRCGVRSVGRGGHVERPCPLISGLRPARRCLVRFGGRNAARGDPGHPDAGRAHGGHGGAALLATGAQIQTIPTNPQASPFTLGLSAAAGFGAALVPILGVAMLPSVVGWIMPRCRP